MEEKNGLLLDVNEKPSIGKWIILAIQHVFAMFGATILVPILVNSGAGEEVLTIPVALVSSGIGTLIYILCTKGKSPVYLGSSFAFIAPLVAAYLKGGISGAMTGVMVVGLVYVVFAILVRLIGKNWINKLLPPVVIGPMIMIIGLGLAPSAIGQIGLASGTSLEWQPIVVAIVSFLVTAIVAVAAKGFLKVIPFLIGIVSGYLTAIAVGIVDFTPFTEAAVVGVPNFVIPFIHYTPNFSAILTIVPIALVTMAEHIGDHTALSTIINKDLLQKPGLDRTLLGDGLATFVAGAIGGPANTTYGENTSVVGMTKVASVWVIGLAAIIAIVLGFFSKFTALVSTIPNAVLGGVSLLLYGFIAVNGLKVLIQNKVNFNDTKNVVVASAMLVLGLGGAAISIVSGDISVTISGMSLAAIVGIILNLCLPKEKEEKIEEIQDKVVDEEEQKDEIIVNEKVLSEEIKEENKTKEKKQPTKSTTKKTTKVADKSKKTSAKDTTIKKSTTKKNTEKKTDTEKEPAKKSTKTTTKKKSTAESKSSTQKKSATGTTTARKKSEAKPKTTTTRKKQTKNEELNV